MYRYSDNLNVNIEKQSRSGWQQDHLAGTRTKLQSELQSVSAISLRIADSGVILPRTGLGWTGLDRARQAGRLGI